MERIEVAFFDIVKKILIKLPIILLCAILGGGAAYAYVNTHRHITYTATVTLYAICNTDASELQNGINDITLANQIIPTYIEVLHTETMLQKVAEKINLRYKPKQINNMMGASQAGKTPFFYVYVTCENAEDAMNIANAIAEIAPQCIYDVLRIGYVQTIDPAMLPMYPDASNDKLKVLIGVATGGIIPVLIILILSILDTKIYREYDLKAYYEYPILGQIPNIKVYKKK